MCKGANDQGVDEMADLVVVMGVLAFFAISVLYVGGCERIIGSEEPTSAPGTSDVPGEERASTAGAAR
jgi:hypothetical protein